MRAARPTPLQVQGGEELPAEIYTNLCYWAANVTSLHNRQSSDRRCFPAAVFRVTSSSHQCRVAITRASPRHASHFSVERSAEQLSRVGRPRSCCDAVPPVSARSATDIWSGGCEQLTVSVVARRRHVNALLITCKHVNFLFTPC